MSVPRNSPSPPVHRRRTRTKESPGRARPENLDTFMVGPPSIDDGAGHVEAVRPPAERDALKLAVRWVCSGSLLGR